jgi:hypothetical protein
MSFRVNLLNKTERRYQGIVSMKVMVLGSLSVLVGTTVVVLSLAGISQAGQKANLKRSRLEWDRISPQAEAVRVKGIAAEKNQKTLARLDVWVKGGNAPMYQILREVQKEIPAAIQLKSLRAGIMKGEDKNQSDFYMLRLSGTDDEMVGTTAASALKANKIISNYCGEILLKASSSVNAFAMEGRRPLEDTAK